MAFCDDTDAEIAAEFRRLAIEQQIKCATPKARWEIWAPMEWVGENLGQWIAVGATTAAIEVCRGGFARLV